MKVNGGFEMRNVLLVVLAMASLGFGEKWYQGAGGDDNNDGHSWANRKATLQCAFDSLSAEDTLYLNGETISAKIDIDLNGHAAATSATPVYVYGVNSSGTVLTDSNHAKITTASTISALCSLGVGADHFRFNNILFDGGGNGKASSCIVTAAADGSDGHIFIECRITNASSHGIKARTDIAQTNVWKFISCEIDNNGKGGSGDGISTLATSRFPAYLVRCRVHDNAGIGCYFGGSQIHLVSRCLVYNNTSDGIKVAAVGGWIFTNNTFYGNGGDALDLAANSYIFSVENNIASTNTGYFINTNSSDIDYYATGAMRNNCTYNNGNVIDINGGSLPSGDNITGNPKFVSVTDESEDFNLQSDSPCKNSGAKTYAK